MDPQEFINFLDRKEIPPKAPYFCVPGNFLSLWHLDHYRYRDEAIKRGMWAIVTQSWVTNMADWIDNRSVLEVMSGRGWLAKALSEQGVTITATDDFSWKINGHKPVFNVIKQNAWEAAKQSQDDLLLMSWPPYDDNTATRVIEAWGPDRPIIYIGEGEGGCNADDEFFRLFKSDLRQPDLWLPRWPHIHDYIQIGRYYQSFGEA